MVVRVTIGFPGEDVPQFDALLTRWRNASVHPFRGNQFRRDAVGWFEKMQRAQFRTLGGRTGRKWAPWAKSTRKRKARDGMDSKRYMLRDTGWMLRAYTDSGSEGAVRHISDAGMNLGVNIADEGRQYPVFHQLGTSRMPRRRVLDVTEKDGLRLMKLVQRNVVRLVDAENFQR